MTNARFALVSPGSSKIEQIENLKCSDFEDIQSAILYYLSSQNNIDIQYGPGGGRVSYSGSPCASVVLPRT